ncbi:hypothetical protein [Cytobacillus purgationiresistens]|uniref:Uncharacterized protein n=1 Tax=Cytobacillus purgationiresistens TaxID=863449 RepID=A0ABU0AAH4_9BACI|nr:hypothetical protein [Cytobacillus purgationiresistens]MDQ0268257.1 hypothetical protein [Cytobacillus purgationiresistens]
MWKGDVYEVKLKEFVPEDMIDGIIGEVETKPNEMTGNYYGNASNHFPKGTEYFFIIDTPPHIRYRYKER